MHSIPLSLLLAAALLAGCGGETEVADTDEPEVELDLPVEQETQAAAPPPTPPNQVDVLMVGLEFEAPDTVPAGWTTFNVDNQSNMVHFAIIERMPSGIGIEEQQTVAAPIFQRGMELLLEGKEEEASKTFAELPPWFGDLVFFGGPGMVAPGRTASATVKLEPGTHVLECYVKTDGVFHSYSPDPDEYGMVHEFTVTENASDGTTPPQADTTITISKDRGIEAPASMTPGPHTIAVNFEDQALYDNFVGHDVHVARLDDTGNTAELNGWMDWRQPGGLETPAPAVFVGGTNEMPAGETAYFTLDLEPGRYAWISEVPEPEAKGMLKVFEVR